MSGALVAGGARERIMLATIRCVERDGVRGFSLEDVAGEAGVSRTTVYRHFPEGRAQLVQETATWEVGRFWTRIATAVADQPTLEDRLVEGFLMGNRMIRSSRIMANLMDPDLDELVSALRPAEPLVHSVIVDYLRALLVEEAAAGRLRPGTDPGEAADYLARMILSVMGSPAGVDLADPVATRDLVRRQFLAGIVTPRAGK